MSTSIQKKIGFCRLLANTILRLGRPREFVTTPEARQCLTCGNREASFLKGGADHAQLRGNTWSGPRDPGSNSPAGLPVLARRFFCPFWKIFTLLRMWVPVGFAPRGRRQRQNLAPYNPLHEPRWENHGSGGVTNSVPNCLL
jgi:hypothetical protein